MNRLQRILQPAKHFAAETERILGQTRSSRDSWRKLCERLGDAYRDQVKENARLRLALRNMTVERDRALLMCKTGYDLHDLADEKRYADVCSER